MNPYLIALILGIVEGLTEFLPVSSTAHIQIVGNIIGHRYGGWEASDPFWKAFAVVIQFGAVACLPIYFWPRITQLVRTFPKGQQNDRNILNHPVTLVLIAFACTVGPVLVFKKLISENLENFKVMAIALIVGGVVMWIVDLLFRKGTTADINKMSIPQAIWVGLIQCLAAIFPGTSRSMATIAAGQTAGMTRAAALEFSFFLSIPTMFAATSKEFLDVIRHKDDFAGLAPLTSEQYIQLAIGLATAFVVSLVVVHFFMGWVRKHGFIPFAVYRIVVGGVLLWWTLK